MYHRLCWYAGEKYLRDLKAKEDFPTRILESVEALAEFLVAEVRTIERGTEASKKEAKDQVPGDRIKDAPAMARELRWRCKLAAGYASDDDSSTRPKGKAGVGANGTAAKRKRVHEDDDALALFRNFRPKRWDKVVSKPTETEAVKTHIRRTIVDNDRQWETDWDLSGKPEGGEGADQVTVERSRTTMTRIRRTAQGFERQRIERVVETWAWEPADEAKHPPAAESRDNGEPEDVVMAEPQNESRASEEQGEETVATDTVDVKAE